MRLRHCILVALFLAPLLLVGWWVNQPLNARTAAMVARMAVAPPTDTVPPFPEARGPGALVMAVNGGCRDSMINHGVASKRWHVTNLNNDGVGSLRNAIQNTASFPTACNYILFDVGGTVDLTARMFAGGINVYVAGQTAPGAGIQVTGQGLVTLGQHQVWRHIAFRYNSSRQLETGAADTLIYDHLSLSHTVSQGGGQNVLNVVGIESSGDTVNDVTISHVMFGVADISHPTQSHCGGTPGPSPAAHRCMFLRNAFLGDATNRKPLMSVDTGWVIENIAFNWNDKGAMTDSESFVNFRQLYGKPGPATNAGFKNYPLLLLPNCGEPTEGDGVCSVLVYVEGIRSPRNGYAVNADFGSMVDDSSTNRVVACFLPSEHWTCGGDGDTVPDSLFSLVPFGDDSPAGSKATLVIQTITDARVDELLDLGTNNCAGDCRALLPDGSWSDTSASGVRRRMWYDSALVQEFKDSVGAEFRDLVNGTVADAPGANWDLFTPIRASGGSAPTDSDGDDLPDAFELRWFSDLDEVWDGDLDDDWYTNGDEYLNGTDPTTHQWSTYATGRSVYLDTLDLIDSIFQPSTVNYPVGVGSTPYLSKPKSVTAPNTGGPVLILSDTPITGQGDKLLDSATLSDTLDNWAQCTSRGLCIDSLRNRSIP